MSGIAIGAVSLAAVIVLIGILVHFGLALGLIETGGIYA